MKTYIQIGANVGKDDFQELIQSINERVKVILVEPNSKLTPILSDNYSNLENKHEMVICSFGIALADGMTNIHLYDTSGVSSLLYRRVGEIREIIKIPVLTFDSLCTKFSINEIEYLCIDTEGLDYEIMNSIDLSKVTIKTIVFEKWNIDNDDSSGIYRTGIDFLNEFVVPKFKGYKWEDIVMELMPTYKLTKLE